MTRRAGDPSGADETGAMRKIDERTDLRPVVGHRDAPLSAPGEQAELALLVASGLNAHEIAATMGWPLSKVYRRLVQLRIAIERRTASRLRALQHRRNASRAERKS